jgi:serine/threonine protein kinase
MTAVGGRYRLIAPIGAGGMATVWRAHDERLERPVAVKEITGALLSAPADLIAEARASARLDHPNVVQVYDVVHEGPYGWIVMEFVDGPSLHDVVQQRGRLSPPAAAQVGVAVLSALRAAHSAGVVHRDVKPRNVLIAADGRVLLTDFGLATVPAGESAPGGSGELLGSPFFVAPERLRGRDAGPSGDLWSLGATLYAAVDGRPPFERDTVAGSLTAALRESPNPSDRLGPLRPIIRDLLIKDPGRRASAADTYLALLDVATRPPVESKAGSTSAAIAATLYAGRRPPPRRRGLRRLR